jgi:hypothetical protein
VEWSGYSGLVWFGFGFGFGSVVVLVLVHLFGLVWFGLVCILFYSHCCYYPILYIILVIIITGLALALPLHFSLSLFPSIYLSAISAHHCPPNNTTFRST